MLRAPLEAGIRDRITPGGVLVVVDQGAPTRRIAFGTTQTEPPGSGQPVTLATLYDVASLTKPVVTVAVMMKLVARGTVELDQPATRWLPEWRADGAERVRIRDLLCHASGLPAHLRFYERLLAGERMGCATAREAMLRMVAAAPLEAEPGSRALYSDLGFTLLGFAAERAGGDRLDRLAAALVFQPLGMTASRFVDLERAGRPTGVAATERCPYRGVVVGEVHDQNTHAAGGVLGQAGLFSTADDIARFAIAMMVPAGGFSRELVDRFMTPSGVTDSRWRLGWDTPSPVPGESHAGERWPRTGAGHLGFTGCSIWIDRDAGRGAVLLTNSIHPVVQKPRTKAFRRAVMHAVCDELAM